MSKIIKIFVFAFAFIGFLAFPQIVSAQWPSDIESGSGSGQQVKQPQKTVNTQSRSNFSQKASQKGMIPVSKFGMNFQFPASWMTTDEGIQEPVLFVGFLPLADNNFRDNIVICGENLSQQMNAQEYFDLNLQQLQGIKILNKGKVTIDGYEGRVIKYVADIQGGSLQQEQIYIVVGNRGYVITISSLPDRFEKSRKDAYRVVNTITF